MKVRRILQEARPRAVGRGLITKAGVAAFLWGSAASAGGGPDERPHAPVIVVEPIRAATPVRVVGHDDDQELSFGTAQRVEVRIHDGEVTVRIDGEDVPAAQVLRDDGRIVILDEDGKEVRSINIGHVGDEGDHKFGFHFGDGEDRLWIVDEANVKAGVMKAEPKVMMGIHLGQPGPALERHLRLEPGSTTMVTAVYEGLPAANAGLEEYDVITEIDGDTPADPTALNEALAGRNPGDVVRLRIIHAGSPKDVRVRLAAYDREAMAAATLLGGGGSFFFSGEADAQPLFKAIEKFRSPEGGVEWDLFVDENNRFFEALPRQRLELRRQRGEGPGGARPDGTVLDARLDRLDTRLEALERMLDAFLEEAAKKRE